MLPWIIVIFVALAVLAVLLTMIVILMSVYMPEDGDSSDIIASGVIFAAVMGEL